LCSNIPSVLIFRAVEIKLIAPSREDTPARCRENIAKSTEPPECDCIPDKGGYTVQPVPAPFSTNALNKSNNSEGGNNQNEILFKRGNAISGAPICTGKK
jgi:hypothetical protein